MSVSGGEMPRTFKLVTIWLLIGVALFLAVLALMRQAERARFSVDAGSGRIVLQRAPDGHFHWPGRVNGTVVEFLVDTGATSTALPQALADSAGLALEGPVRSSTAGGVVSGQWARADVQLKGGVRVDSLRVTVLPRLSAPLLGMDVISKMRLTQSDGVLTLEVPR